MGSPHAVNPLSHQGNITANNVDQVSSDLKTIISGGGQAGIGDVEAAADVIGEISEAATECNM